MAKIPTLSDGAAASKRRPTSTASRPLRRAGAATGPAFLPGRTAAGGRAAWRPGRLGTRRGVPAARPLGVQEASKGAGSK